MRPPNDPNLALKRRQLIAHGMRLCRAGQFAQVEHVCRQLGAIAPDDPDGLRLLGLLRHAQGDATSAANLLGQAVRVRGAPGADMLCEFGHALMDAGQIAVGVGVLEQAVEADKQHVGALNLLGIARVMAGQHEAAVLALNTAVEIAPKFATAWSNLATALQFLGRADEARTAYENALSADRDFACLYNYAQLHKFQANDPLFKRMRQRWEARTYIDMGQQIDLGFGLAKALDDLGEYAESFSVLAEANAIKRKSFAYSAAGNRERFAALRQVVTPAWLDSVALDLAVESQPIFIVGMPRSGSTLVEQILASHSRVRGGGELPYFPRALERVADQLVGGSMADTRRAVSQLAAEYLENVRELSAGHAYFTDKLPENFVHLGLIHAAFPQARLIHIRRDPLDTCLSCFQCNFSGVQPFAYDLDELADYYLDYRVMMSYWHSVLGPGRIHQISYEQLISDPEAEIRSLLEYCELPWERDCLQFHESKRAVSTASANQVRKPLYASSVGRWQRYSEQLAPVRERIGTEVDQV